MYYYPLPSGPLATELRQIVNYGSSPSGLDFTSISTVSVFTLYLWFPSLTKSSLSHELEQVQRPFSSSYDIYPGDKTRYTIDYSLLPKSLHKPLSKKVILSSYKFSFPYISQLSFYNFYVLSFAHTLTTTLQRFVRSCLP